MKNYEEILSEAGVTLTEEQKAAAAKGMGENYKPIADWQKQVDKVEGLTEQLNTVKEELKKYDGVDIAAKDKTIADLQADLASKEAEYQEKIADRDFQDNVKTGIAKFKGKNEKAIRALLDMEALKASKNQNEDIEKALKALTEAEDSKMLFGEAEQEEVGSGNPIGSVTKGGGSNDFAAMRAAFGLPEEKKN